MTTDLTAVLALMSAMGCKIEEDEGECHLCGEIPHPPHERFHYCVEHDWIEHGHTVTTCAYAARLADALAPVIRAEAERRGES